MRRFILYFIIFLCFCLSGWQVYRFVTQYQNYRFFIKQNDLIDSNQKIFIDDSVGDLYFWQEKSYQINLQNNKIYQVIESFVGDDKKKDDFKREAISRQNLFFKNKICGRYIPNYNFALYKAKKIGDFTKNGYSIIIPMIFNQRILLVNYFWSESLEEGRSEIEKLNNFNDIQKGFLPEKLLIKKDVGLCFEGVLIPIKKYYSHWVLNFFAMNDLEKNIWSNLNKRDLKKYLQPLVKNNEISDTLALEYILDSNLKDFSNFLKNYQHHFFYAIMWFISGAYLIYIVKKFTK
jgi:hypothetical protein